MRGGRHKIIHIIKENVYSLQRQYATMDKDESMKGAIIMALRVEDFGMTAQGEKTRLYIFTNEKNTEMAVSDYGATWANQIVLDKEGNPCDVVLGYDDVSGYAAGTCFFGAVVGRSANRIGNAAFTIDGKEYHLTKNDNKNNLHSGPDFYSNRMWTVEETGENYIKLSLNSPDGDQGYPGNLAITVTYTLTDDNEVQIEYQAVPDQDTIVNLTNHSYFNLSGHASGTILDQSVWLDADAFTAADEESIPTGELVDVTGTPMDFRKAKAVGRDIEESYQALIFGQGYDHNWALNNNGGYARIASLTSEVSGIQMEVYTDLPGVQFYTGNFITDEVGKNGAHYHKRQGLCFETQYFPDAANKKQFASPICKAGESYITKTTYKFL